MRAMPRQFLIWCCCLLLVQLATALTGDNVCKRTETNSETIEYVVTEPVTYRLYTWCLKMPPRCSKYTTVMKERIKTKLQINNHTIDFCCDGYVQLETYCVPECNKTECPHMNCDSEKKCICEAGYYGQRCHRTCRTGFWGENCANKCVCNGEPCNLVNGDCLPTTTSPFTTIYPNNSTVSQHNTVANESRIASKTSATKSLNNNQISPLQTTVSLTPTQRQSKSEKNELSQEIQESDVDPTMIPIGVLEDIDTTLLPEDEVIIVYPSTPTKSYSPSTSQLETKRIKSSSATTTTKKTTQKLMQTDNVTKLPHVPEKIKKSTTPDYYSKMHDLKYNKNKLFDTSVLSTTEQTRINIEYNNSNDKQKTNLLNNKKYYGSTVIPNVKNIKYNSENLLPKKSNGLPPPVPDGSDNSLQIKINGIKNISILEENDENGNNNNIIKSNDIQRDMEELNNSNYSRPNIDTTVNSSLVKAKWNSALGVIDFSAPSIIISITGTVILFLALTVVVVTHCKKNKSESSTSSFYDNNVKACHHDNAIPYSGHYASPGGQPIFFCPSFTNTYAFELAQELREAHYDHPRSARCLTNEPVYAELQY